jgi:thymidylate kinase
MYTPNIVIEGGDKTGKSTLQKNLLHKYPYSKRYFVSDRSIMTRMMYNCLRGEKEYNDAVWLQDLINFLCNNAMIILYADDKEIVKRYNKEGDDEHKLSDIRTVNRAYKDAIENELGAIKFIKPMDTTSKGIDTLVDDAATWIDEIVKYDIHDKVRNLMSLVLTFGSSIGYPGKELRNVRIADCKSAISHMTNTSLCEESENYVRKAKLEKGTRARYEMDVNNYKSFYSYLFASLFYKIESEIKFHGEDPLTSRRFHIVPPQGSCTSSMGVNFRTNMTKGIDMFCTVNMRSSDIVILPYDIDNCQRVFIDLIRPNSAIKLFGKGFTNQIQNFYFNYNFESVHVLDANGFRNDYNYM